MGPQCGRESSSGTKEVQSFPGDPEEDEARSKKKKIFTRDPNQERGEVCQPCQATQPQCEPEEVEFRLREAGGGSLISLSRERWVGGSGLGGGEVLRGRGLN
jgi:hypothetical protein